MMGHFLEGREKLAGYRMIDDLFLENFRCFERLELKKLPRVNVIVGENATGKTALLEGLWFAAAGTPESLMRLRAFRGYWEGQLAISTDRRAYEGLWRECFYKFDYTKAIVAKIVGSAACSRETKVSYSLEGVVPLNVQLPNERPDLLQDTYSQVPLVFSGTDANGRDFKYRADLTPRGVYFDARLQMVPAVYFPSSTRTPQRETAERFTAIDVGGELGKLVATINKPFPFIKGLSLGSHGGSSVIYTQVAELKEKIPIGVVSNGIEKLVNILLGITASTNGAVLVDELDGFVHYTKISDVWAALREFADAYSSQLFVSTHSAEWLTALLPVLKGHEDEFGLLRVSIVEGKHVVRQYTGAQVAGALNQDGEIR